MNITGFFPICSASKTYTTSPASEARHEVPCALRGVHEDGAEQKSGSGWRHDGREGHLGVRGFSNDGGTEQGKFNKHGHLQCGAP